jgi:hypothetical protein
LCNDHINDQPYIFVEAGMPPGWFCAVASRHSLLVENFDPRAKDVKFSFLFFAQR